MAGHDIIVIGASMGGIEALSDSLKQLPEDLPAALVVVQHIGPRSSNALAQFLGRAGSLKARLAEDMEPIQIRGPVPMTCPECHGPLWKIKEDPPTAPVSLAVTLATLIQPKLYPQATK